jgi:hypothetical protein
VEEVDKAMLIIPLVVVGVARVVLVRVPVAPMVVTADFQISQAQLKETV